MPDVISFMPNIFSVILIFILIAYIINIVFAYYVYEDAKNHIANSPNLPPIVWALYVLSLPGLGIIAYWHINRTGKNR